MTRPDKDPADEPRTDAAGNRSWMCECGHPSASHDGATHVGACRGKQSDGSPCPCAEFDAEGTVAQLGDKFLWKDGDLRPSSDGENQD